MKKLIFVKKLKKTDLKKLVKFRNHKIIWQFTGKGAYNKKISLDDEKEWFKKINKKKDRLNLSINLNEKYIGNVYFTNIKKTSAQFHIFIGVKSLWGKGIGTKATLLSLNFLRKNYGIKKIYLKVKKENLPAIKVYKKCGFKIKKKFNDNNYLMINY